VLHARRHHRRRGPEQLEDVRLLDVLLELALPVLARAEPVDVARVLVSERLSLEGVRKVADRHGHGPDIL
jgi:hypothetical protein